MTNREKLVELINHVCEHHIENLLQPGGAEALADHLLANGVTVQPSPQNNHRKICPTTGLECIACVPGSPCANLEQELESAQCYEPMTR